MGQALLIIVGGLLLLGAGAGLGYWYALTGRQKGRADQLQEELDEYRQNVNRHFAQTAEHFQTIGREYRALYQHMASGAEALCDPQEIDGRLSFEPAAGGAAGAAGENTADDDPAPERDDDTTTDASAGSGDADEQAAAQQATDSEPETDNTVSADTDTEDATSSASAEETADDDADARARAAGGESAPVDEDDGVVQNGSAEADGEAAVAESDVAAEGASKSGESERTYH